MRFHQEMNRLKIWYLSRSRKLKHAPKVFNALDEIDLESDKAVTGRAEYVLKDYRVYRHSKYLLAYNEMVSG